MNSSNGYDIQEFLVELFLKCKYDFPCYGIVAKLKGSIVGACLSFPHEQDVQTANKLPIELEAFLRSCEGDVVQSLLENYTSLMDYAFVYSDKHLPNKIGLEILYMLNEEVIKIGKKFGHDAIYTCNNSAATQSMDTEVHGYIVKKVVHPKLFFYNGEYPYKHMDIKYTAEVCVKHLSNV